jgi:hypothetical protein
MMLPGSSEQDLLLLAEHLTAEQAKSISYDGSHGIAYEQIPGRDNDWFDCVVGCAVGASMLGCSLAGENVRRPVVRRSLSEIKKMAMKS